MLNDTVNIPRVGPFDVIVNSWYPPDAMVTGDGEMVRLSAEEEGVTVPPTLPSLSTTLPEPPFFPIDNVGEETEGAHPAGEGLGLGV